MIISTCLVGSRFLNNEFACDYPELGKRECHTVFHRVRFDLADSSAQVSTAK